MSSQERAAVRRVKQSACFRPRLRTLTLHVEPTAAAWQLLVSYTRVLGLVMIAHRAEEERAGETEEIISPSSVVVALRVHWPVVPRTNPPSKPPVKETRPVYIHQYAVRATNTTIDEWRVRHQFERMRAFYIPVVATEPEAVHVGQTPYQ